MQTNKRARRRRLDRLGPALVLAVALGAGAIAQPAAATSTDFDSSYGQPLFYADDGGAQIDLPFAFSFFGQSYSYLNISSNGYVTLTDTSGDLNLGDEGWLPSAASMMSGPARIAPEWFDWISTVYVDKSQSGRVMITWDGTAYEQPGEFTAQLQLFSDGQIVFAYDNDGAPLKSVLAGISAGGGAVDPGEVNFVAADLSADGVPAIYQASTAGQFPNNVGVTFTPDDNGGYAVAGGVPSLPPPADGGGSTGAVPEPGPWALMILGIGGLGVTLRRQRAIARVQRSV